MRILLQSGADVNATDDSNDTALSQAALHGYTDICKQLLHAGADPSIRDRWGFDAVDDAKQRGHRELARLLSDTVGRTVKPDHTMRK